MSMTYQSPPPTYYSTVMSNNSRSYSPELNDIDSPTYSFSSSSTSRPSSYYFEEQFPMIKKEEQVYNNTLVKREVLSPLPDSFYDAYSYQLTTPTSGLPLLTPPATSNNNEIEFQDICYHPPPPPTCYTPGCHCSTTGFYTNNSGMMSPFYDPTPYTNTLSLPPPPPPPQQQQQMNYNKRPSYQGKQINRHYSLDSIHSTLSTSSEKTTLSTTTNTTRSNNSTPRRYKCTLCVKRFTRPSSLATHMHSHTGEKPYKCVVEGCGRRFSVVSNLRRHAKIHSHIP